MKTKLLSLTHLLLIQLILAFSSAQAQKLIYFDGGWGTDSDMQIRSFNEEQTLDGLSDFTAQFSYRTNVDRWLVFDVDARQGLTRFCIGNGSSDFNLG